MRQRVYRVIELIKKKEVILAFLAIVILSFFLSWPVHWLMQEMQEKKVSLIVTKVRESVAAEKSALLDKTTKISKAEVLPDLITQGNINKIKEFLQQLKERQQLDLAAITDSNGLVLARARFSSKAGDYIFQSTVWGQVLAEQKSFVSVEKGNIVPLAFSAGAPIFEKNKFVGTITVGYLMDDDFAQAMKEKYNLTGGEVAFYSMEEGLIGSSFKDLAQRKIIFANASLGSDLIKSTSSGECYKIGDRHFLVQNIPFEGLNGSVGGLLVFLPDKKIQMALTMAVILALLFALLFGLVLYKLHIRHYKMVVVYSMVAVLAGSFIVSYFWKETKIINLLKSEMTIYNSTLAVEPPSALLNKSFSYPVSVKITTGGESINAITASLDFNPDLVKINKIITTNSICKPEMFVEKIIDNEAGKVKVSCLMPNPGFTESGLVAELELQPQAFGQFSLTFDDDSQVLANDGQGTDVLRLATGASFDIPSVTAATSDPDNQPLLVFSTSNPNREKWYNNKRNLFFAWYASKTDHGEYYYEINKTPEFIPQTHKSTAGRVTLFVKDDGVYYFHLAKYQQNKLMAAVHYKVKIDSTPPTRPEVRVNSARIKAGEVAWFDFKSRDNLSGMQPNYYFKLDEGVFLPVASPLHLSFDKNCAHTVTIRAYDKANNFSDTIVKIEVK